MAKFIAYDWLLLQKFTMELSSYVLEVPNNARIAYTLSLAAQHSVKSIAS